MRLKFQKRSVLKFVSRTPARTVRRVSFTSFRISWVLFPAHWGEYVSNFLEDTPLLAAGRFIYNRSNNLMLLNVKTLVY